MIVARAVGLRVRFTKRIGYANMRHDGAAKRRLSWAWMGAMRGQVRCVRARGARSTEVELVEGRFTRGSQSLTPGSQRSPLCGERH